MTLFELARALLCLVLAAALIMWAMVRLMTALSSERSIDSLHKSTVIASSAATLLVAPGLSVIAFIPILS